MEEESKEEICYTDKIKDMVTKELQQLSTTELNENNLDILFKLVDIYKDLENVDYWNVKKEVMQMRYNNYGNYSDGGYGNYGNYGRRGVPGSGRGYRGYSDGYSEGYSEGEEMLENMKESYGAYSESMSAYSRGNYNAGQDSMKALEDTMQIFTEFAHKMLNEVEGPEAQKIIKKHLRKISQMGGM